MARKLKTLSAKQKVEIINHLKRNTRTKKEITSEYDCNISTVNRIWKNQEELKHVAQKNAERKRARKSKYEDVEKALTAWFDQARSQNAILTGTVLLNKAKELAIKLNSDFEPNNGWLWRWQKRENIKFKKMHGEANASDHTSADDFIKNILPGIIENYSPEDIFNADESGLFYKALPNGTLARTAESAKGNKSQKIRLSLLFLCNAAGSDKKVYSIGKSKNPRCFRNKSLPINYYCNKNAWMTSSLWSTIIIDFDKEMTSANRKVILFVDNASCHKVNLNLQSVKI